MSKKKTIAKLTRAVNPTFSSDTLRVGDRIMHGQKAASNVDLQHIRQFRNHLKGANKPKVLKRGRDGEPIVIRNEKGQLVYKRSDGKWWID